MPLFSYVAVDPHGQQITGQIEAADQAAAAALIKQSGYFPTRVTLGVAPVAEVGKKTMKKKSGGKVKAKVLTIFTRQLATLIGSGLPLLRGLNTLGRQERDVVLKQTLESIAEAIEGGSTFSEALAQHPQIFTKLYVNMVKAGELGGVLEVVLARLAEFQEKSERIKGKVMSAMAYPAVVLTLAFVILIFLLMVIVPKFQAIFTDMLNGKPLPFLTEFVVNLSSMVGHNIILIIGVVVVAVVGFKAFAASTSGAQIIDRLKLTSPGIGNLVSKTAISRFARTLGTLVSSGVPILPALNITKETAGNYVVATAIEKIHDSVKEGETIVTPMEASGIFPPIVVSMVQVGEEVGRLPEMLVKVADVYDEEVDNAVGALTSLMEPIMIVILAVIVGTIVIALFLPLISIIQNLGSQTN